MVWGQFSAAHWISLLVAAGVIAGLYFLLRKVPERVQNIVLGILSFSGIVAIMHNFVTWGDLPLQLCSLNALLLPVLVFTKNCLLGNLLMVWGLGAALALIYNVNVADELIFSTAFNLYYFPHMMECAIPWLMILLGKVKKRPKYIATTLGITVGAYTLVHFVNLWLETAYGGQVFANYMYSMGPTTSLAQAMWNILPCRYWYMYLAIPLILVFLLVVYAPELKAAWKNRK